MSNELTLKELKKIRQNAQDAWNEGNKLSKNLTIHRERFISRELAKKAEPDTSGIEDKSNQYKNAKPDTSGIKDKSDSYKMELRKGGLATKKYCNPVKIVDNLKNRKKKK